jgi:feruloyl-CoA synthase
MTSARIPLRFGPSEVEITRRPDGAIIVRSPHPLPVYPRAMTDRLEYWAERTPDQVFLAQRDVAGVWRKITYRVARDLVRSVAQAFLDRDLSAKRPVAVLSGNEIDHALIGLGAMYAGIPYAPISVAYSLVAKDFFKLQQIFEILTPGVVFANDGVAYDRAITKTLSPDVEIVTRDRPLVSRASTPLAELYATKAGPAVDAAHSNTDPDAVAKLLFTSGSTGVPKGVINTQRMMTSNQVMNATCFPSFSATPPVLLDWLPWSHTYGGNHNFNLVLMNGGTLYIDEGKPLPGAIEATVRNLRDVAPTVYFNVPKGFEMLLPYLRAEPALRQNLFSRLQCCYYAGATLPPHVWKEYEAMALETTGESIPMLTSLGSTETAPSALNVTPKARRPGVIGIPVPGIEMKLVPNAGKLEVRLRGPSITPGYWRQPDLTAAAFDEERYYKLGDSLRFADENEPEQGFVFDGRIAEDFKLTTGTWVSVGPLKARFVAHFGPLARDVVIAGQDRDDIAALVVPDVDACRAFVGLDPAAEPNAILGHETLRTTFSARLTNFNAQAGGSSERIFRLILMEDPPSLDTGEMTDKGSINQRAVLKHRAALVEELYAEAKSPRVIVCVTGKHQ